MGRTMLYGVKAALYDLIYLAPSYLERGKIHADLGETEKAIDCYEKFITLWSDADPEMHARVDEAEKRLAGLRDA